MPNYKGAGLIIVEKLFAKQTPDLREAFVVKLTPAEQQFYKSVLATQWQPIATVAAVFEKAVGFLYPGNRRGLEEMGRQQALDNISGIYRSLLRITTIEFTIKQVAKLWRSYFDEGEASARQEHAEKRVTMTVENFPDLPLANRRVVSGYIQGTLELCGAHNVQVLHDGSQAGKWIWSVTWT